MTQLLKPELKLQLKNTHLEVKQKPIIQQGYTHPV